MAQVLPFKADPAATPPAPRAQPYLGDVLVRSGRLAPEALAVALDQQRDQDTPARPDPPRRRADLARRADRRAQRAGARSGGSTSTPGPPIRPWLPRPIPIAAWSSTRCRGGTFAGRRVIAVANPSRGAEALAAFGGEALALAPGGGDPADDRAATSARRMVRDAEARCPADDELPDPARRRVHGPQGDRARRAGRASSSGSPGPLLGRAFAWVLVAQVATVGLRLLALFTRWRAPRRAPAEGGHAALGASPQAPRLDPRAAEGRGRGRRTAARRAPDDGLSRAAPRHQARARGATTRDARRDRARRACRRRSRSCAVPRGTVETKPRAMNYALPFCRGEIVGDLRRRGHARSAADQGRRRAPDGGRPARSAACRAISTSTTPTTICSRAGSPWTTRCGSASSCSASSALGLPIPLGGTTVFFRRRGARGGRLLGRAQRHRGRRPRHAARARGLSLRDDRDDDGGGGLRRQRPALDPPAVALAQGLRDHLGDAHAATARASCATSGRSASRGSRSSFSAG